MNDSIPKRRSYHTLDGMRGIAAISVVILHTPHFFGGWKLPDSFLAVDLFFVLSGFVLAAAYEPKFQLGMKPTEFLRIRVIRLYPLYILSTVLGVPVAVLAMKFAGLSVSWTPTLFWVSLPLSVAMIPTPKIGPTDVLYPFNPVLWSILFELLINVVYVSFWRYLREIRIVVSAVALSSIGLVCYAFHAGGLEAGFSWHTFWGGTLRVIFSFFFGVLIFRVVGNRKRKESFVALAIIIALPGIFLLPKSVFCELISVLFVFPTMVVLSSVHEPGPQIQKAFNVLGVASYAVYTVHKPLYQLLLAMLKRTLPFPPESLAPWLGLIYIPVLVGVCMILNSVYDVPLRRMLGRPKSSFYSLYPSLPKAT